MNTELTNEQKIYSILNHLYRRHRTFELCDNGDGTMDFTQPCQFTNTPHTETYNLDELYAWSLGEMIQVAMPTTSKEAREFLISGISPDGWNKTFGKGY